MLFERCRRTVAAGEFPIGAYFGRSTDCDRYTYVRTRMIIVLKPHPAPGVVEHVLERIAALGLTPHLSQGVSRAIIGVIGGETKLKDQRLQAIPGVETVVPILKPFKLASREFHAEDSVFTIKGVKVGGGHLAVIAGPCAIEGESLLFEVAARVRHAGANI